MKAEAVEEDTGSTVGAAGAGVGAGAAGTQIVVLPPLRSAGAQKCRQSWMRKSLWSIIHVRQDPALSVAVVP